MLAVCCGGGSRFYPRHVACNFPYSHVFSLGYRSNSFPVESTVFSMSLFAVQNLRQVRPHGHTELHPLLVQPLVEYLGEGRPALLRAAHIAHTPVTATSLWNELLAQQPPHYVLFYLAVVSNQSRQLQLGGGGITLNDEEEEEEEEESPPNYDWIDASLHPRGAHSTTENGGHIIKQR
jgi:hypothetical protein